MITRLVNKLADGVIAAAEWLLNKQPYPRALSENDKLFLAEFRKKYYGDSKPQAD